MPLGRTWLIKIIVGLLLVWTKTAVAQSFEDAYQSYVRNQIPVAEQQFRAVLKRSKTDADRAFNLKFIGICQYMRGDKKSAQSTFAQAVNLDRDLQIDENEVLEPSVVPFFNLVKNRETAEMRKRALAKQKAAPKVIAKSNPKRDITPRFETGSRARKVKDDGIDSFETRAEEPRSKGKNLSVIHFLPFGAGQFYNGNTILGLGLVAGQLGSLYYAQDSDRVIKETQEKDKLVSENEEITPEKRETFRKDNAAFRKSLQQDKQLALVVFGGLWIGGVLEAVLNPARMGRDAVAVEPRPALNPVWTPEFGGSWALEWKMQIK